MNNKLTKDNMIITEYWHGVYIQHLSAKLIKYYEDVDKKNRKKNVLCKYCFYIDIERIGGAAMTTVKCHNCEEEMIFSSTCTDIVCETCAKKLRICKHCGQKLD